MYSDTFLLNHFGFKLILVPFYSKCKRKLFIDCSKCDRNGREARKRRKKKNESCHV